MQNSSILKIFFFDNIKNDLQNFESVALRKNLKASLELNDLRYLTNAIDENIKVVEYINFNDHNKFNFFKGKELKKVSYAFYSEFENDSKVLSVAKPKSEKKYLIKENNVKILSKYDLLFVPSIEAKELLLKEGIETNIEVLFPPIRRTKFDLKDREIQNLIYIYFHLEENNKYVYTFLDNVDSVAAKRVVEFARIFSNLKIIVVIPRLKTKEARAVNKYFRKTAQNVYTCPVLSEDIYASLVYNAFAYINVNTLYTGAFALFEAFSCGVNCFTLKENSFKDIAIDKQTSYVYNDFDSLINGFNEFLSQKIPSLSDKEKEFVDKNDIRSIGRRFVEINEKYFEE